MLFWFQVTAGGAVWHMYEYTMTRAQDAVCMEPDRQ